MGLDGNEQTESTLLDWGGSESHGRTVAQNHDHVSKDIFAVTEPPLKLFEPFKQGPRTL